MEKRKAYIFDIDGTIADNGQRQQWVKQKPKNWNAYNKGMAQDKPINSTIQVLKTLNMFDDIVICSGREEVYRSVTEQWLKEQEIFYDELYMRKAGDYRDDCIVKKEMLDLILPIYDVVAVFDDRPKVCRMWVENGIFVFRCQQIEEEF